MVLDDDEFLIQHYRSCLKNWFRVDWSPRKESFLDGLTAKPESAPDLVITDLKSAGMDGMEFLRQLKARRLDRLVPVIMASGYRLAGSEFLGLRVSSVLQKPWKVMELRQAVRKALFHSKGLFWDLRESPFAVGRPGRPKLMILDDLEDVVYCYHCIFHREFEITWSLRKDTFLDEITADPGRAPDVVLTDVCCRPLNGIRFLEELWIRGLHELFPVIVVTAMGRWATAIEYGAFDFMQKPFDVGKLKEIVGRALQLKGRSR